MARSGEAGSTNATMMIPEAHELAVNDLAPR
jgi:hypothetical protein